MENAFGNETAGERESRLAMCACLNADMIFRGVKDGIGYFDLHYSAPEHTGPKVTLSLPAEGLTAEKIANHAAEWDRKRQEKREKKRRK